MDRINGGKCWVLGCGQDAIPCIKGYTLNDCTPMCNLCLDHEVIIHQAQALKLDMKMIARRVLPYHHKEIVA